MKLRQIRQSLITRLLLYFLLAGVVTTVIFGISISHGLRVHFKQEILPNIAQYMEYIVQDIGAPPDLPRAQRLTDDLSFELAILGLNTDWQSHRKIPPRQELEFEQAPAPFERFRIAHRHGTNYVLLENGGYEYRFAVGRPFEQQRQRRGLWLLLAVVGVMVVLFLMIRRSLRPLQEIGQDIAAIGEGRLEPAARQFTTLEFSRLAQGIRDMTDQIRHMLEAKHQLLLAISHELRSPLTRARVNVELLPESGEREHLLSDLRIMQELIDQILEAERLNQKQARLQKQRLRLDRLIKEILEQHFNDADCRLELDEIEVCADEFRLGLLLKNLLDNALKFTEKGRPPPEIMVFRDRTSSVIEVQDHGSGIPKEHLDKITQAFYRVDQARLRSTGGVGLGLYLCALVVQAHGGELTITSEVGKGTRVRVALPFGDDCPHGDRT